MNEPSNVAPVLLDSPNRHMLFDPDEQLARLGVA